MVERWRPALTQSLAARLALAVAGLLLSGGIVVSLAAFAYGQRAANEAFDRLLLGAANYIAASLSVRDGRVLVDLPLSAFELLELARDDRITYRVVGVDGITLTGHDSAPLPPGPIATAPRFYDGRFDGEPARHVVVVRRFVERNLSGSVQVIVGQTTLARQDFALELTRNALLVLGLLGAAMALLAVVSLRSALRPLGRIEEVLRNRDPYDLTPIAMDVPREAAAMVTALNSFMSRLERQVTTMRNLIGDTAHQLRTPVAAIRAQADLAAGEPDDARRNAIVARLHRRSVGLSRLLDQMLSRALVIHRADTVRHAPLDLRDIAIEVLESSDHDILQGVDHVRLALPDLPVWVSGDPLSLVEACKNLLGNALRHGRPPIRIGVDGSPGEARIWIADTGSGPPGELLRQAGERFARSAASKSESAGLGLAIAFAVAEAHGGRLTMETTPDGFTIAVALPRDPAATGSDGA